MSRYIDVDILENELQFLYQLLDWDDGGAEKTAFGVAIRKVHETPTADVRKNVHAKKIISGGEHDGATCWFECSSCHGSVDIEDAYCKHCGAVLEYQRGEA